MNWLLYAILGAVLAGTSPVLAKSGMLSMVDSLTAPLSLINALIVALATGREQTLAKTFDALEQVWEEYNVYEKRVENK